MLRQDRNTNSLSSTQKTCSLVVDGFQLLHSLSKASSIYRIKMLNNNSQGLGSGGVHCRSHPASTSKMQLKDTWKPDGRNPCVPSSISHGPKKGRPTFGKPCWFAILKASLQAFASSCLIDARLIRTDKIKLFHGLTRHRPQNK